MHLLNISSEICLVIYHILAVLSKFLITSVTSVKTNFSLSSRKSLALGSLCGVELLADDFVSTIL